MNIRKSLLTIAIALGCLSASAQSAVEVTEYDFTPYFYGQLQIGGQETLGEGSFGKLFSPNAQIAFGYQFNPLFGARLGLDAWQSKGTLEFTPSNPNTDAAKAFLSKYAGGREYWKWNYVAPAVDVTFNLTNVIGGYNPTRAFDVNLFAGIGVNVAWKNDEANAYNDALKQLVGTNGLQYIWDGTKARFMGRFGAMCDYKINDKVKVGVELQANVLSDRYNSKKAGNADWYFNGLVGVKYTFGTSYKKRVRVVDEVPETAFSQTVIQEVVPEVIRDTVEIVREIKVEKPETLRRDIFFTISNTKISVQEMTKVDEIAQFMKENPDTKVTVTGYADAGTGTVAINVRLAKQRAQAVVDALTKTYGIPMSRITMDSMTDHEYQPYKTDVLNRVAICIVK